MVKKIATGIMLGLLALPPAMAHAGLTLADVGGNIDQLIAEKVLGNSGDDTELGWVQSILGSEYTWTENKYDVTTADWTAVDGYLTADKNGHLVNYVYATQLDTAPEYFMLKIANPNSDVTTDGMDHFLFKNLASLDWAVVSLVDMNFEVKFISNIGKVSHIGEFDDPSNPVPEPATMLLLGTGLAGLASSRLRKKK